MMVAGGDRALDIYVEEVRESIRLAKILEKHTAKIHAVSGVVARELGGEATQGRAVHKGTEAILDLLLTMAEQMELPGYERRRR